MDEDEVRNLPGNLSVARLYDVQLHVSPQMNTVELYINVYAKDSCINEEWQLFKSFKQIDHLKKKFDQIEHKFLLRKVFFPPRSALKSRVRSVTSHHSESAVFFSFCVSTRHNV